jgi:hypothetical protein
MSDWMNRTDKEMFAVMFPASPLPPWGWGARLGDSPETTEIIEIMAEEASEYYLATFHCFSMKKEQVEDWVTKYFENPDAVLRGESDAVDIPVEKASSWSKLHFRTVMGDAQPLLDEIDAAGGEVLAVDVYSLTHNVETTTIVWKTVTLPDDMQPYVVLEDLTPLALRHALNQYHDRGYEVMSLDTGPEGPQGQVFYTVVLKHRAI